MSDWKPSAIPGRRLRTFEIVIERISQAIGDGQLHPGDRLPSERDLASALDVSRTSVREATRVLEALGIVQVRVGSGPDRGVSIREHPGDELVKLFEMWVGLQHIDVDDLVRFREAVEGWACMTEPTAPSSEETLDRLGTIAMKMAKTSSKKEYLELDSEFHQQVVRYSGNRLATIVNAAVRGSIKFRMESAFKELDDWDTERERLTVEHQQIFEHLQGKRHEEAREAITQHVRRFYSNHMTS